MVQAWLKSLDRLATSYQRVIFTNLATVLSAAVDDGILIKNACHAPSVRKPRLEPRKITPWTATRVKAVIDALPERYAIVATLAAGLGLRQGEVFGLSPADVDFLRGHVAVNRQVKLFANNRQVFALPKGRKTRTVPLPSSVRDELAAYLAKYPARPVTLPWADCRWTTHHGRSRCHQSRVEGPEPQLLQQPRMEAGADRRRYHPRPRPGLPRLEALVRLGAHRGRRVAQSGERLPRPQRPIVHGPGLHPPARPDRQPDPQRHRRRPGEPRSRPSFPPCYL